MSPRVEHITVHSSDSIVSDRSQGRLLRQVYLRRPSSRPVVLDLSGLRMLRLPAAQEMMVPWLKARAKNAGHRVPVAIKTYSPVGRETLDAVLRKAGEVAYWLPSGAGAPELIGSYNEADADMLETIHSEGGGVTIAPGQPINGLDLVQLERLAAEGILERVQSNEGVRYQDPFLVSAGNSSYAVSA